MDLEQLLNDTLEEFFCNMLAIKSKKFRSCRKY